MKSTSISFTMKFLLVGAVAFAFKRNNNNKVAYSFTPTEPAPAGKNLDHATTRRRRRRTGYQRRNQVLLSPPAAGHQCPSRGYTGNTVIGIRAGSSNDDENNDGDTCVNDSSGGSLLMKNNILATTAATTVLSTSGPILSPSLSSSSSLISSYYYLWWSPGFVKQYGIMSAALLSAYMTGLDNRVWKILSRRWTAVAASLCCAVPAKIASTTSQQLPVQVPRLSRLIPSSTFPNFILPLLSSSCCAIQLAINMMVGAGGCAGFNSILGPVRPYLLACLTYMNVVTGAGIRQWIVRYTVALMPEGVYFWNEYTKSQWRQTQQQQQQQQQQKSTSSSSSLGPVNEGTTTKLASVMVDIPTMGCVACINKIESNLRRCDDSQIKILHATSWLETNKKGGRAKVDFYVQSENDLTVMAQRVVDVIESAGFHGTKVTDLQILPSTTSSSGEIP